MKSFQQGKSSFAFFQSNPACHPKANVSDYQHQRLILPIVELKVNKITECLLCLLFLRLSHIIQCIRTVAHSFLIWEDSIVCINHKLLIHFLLRHIQIVSRVCYYGKIYKYSCRSISCEHMFHLSWVIFRVELLFCRIDVNL